MKKIRECINNYLHVLSADHLYRQIPDDDVIGKQRFVLFRIFSFTGALVSAGAFVKMFLTIDELLFYTYLIPCLSLVLISNFYLVMRVERLRLAYTVLLITACLLLHTVAYTCGGIRTAGTFYFSVIILYAFMLLGRKAGQLFTTAIILHVVYLFYISSHTQLTSFAMFQNKISLINEDFLTNAVLTFCLIAAMSSYLQSGRNVVIQRILRQRDELKEKNYVLEKKNNELDKFASIASHDLKAPLRAIGTLTDMIIDDNGELLNNQMTENLSVIKSRVIRMENLINGLLIYSQVERTNNPHTEVHARYLIDACLKMINTTKKVNLHLPEGMPLLYTDKIKLSQVFSNLLDNAIKFNHKETVSIEVECEEQTDHWLFSVKDNGPGIPQKYHEKIFVIFQTLSARDEVESTGAGLAIIKKIIEDQGGKISVTSVLGNGSTFSFTWKKNKNFSEQMQYQINEFFV